MSGSNLRFRPVGTGGAVSSGVTRVSDVAVMA